MASAERDRAAQRLEAALVEQDRLGERFDAVVGTSTEFGAYVRLRGAGDQVLQRGGGSTGSTTWATEGLNAALSNCSPRAAHSLVLEDWKVATMTSNGGTAPPKGQRDGEVDCTAPMATTGLGRSRPGTTWLRAELAVPG